MTPHLLATLFVSVVLLRDLLEGGMKEVRHPRPNCPGPRSRNLTGAGTMTAIINHEPSFSPKPQS